MPLKDLWKRLREKAVREREYSAQLLEAVIDGLPYAVIVRDADTGEIVTVNRAACTVLDRKREQIVGADARKLGIQVPAPEEDRALLAQRKPVETIDVPVDIAARRRLVRRREIPVRDPRGGRGYVLSVQEDITEWAERESDLRRRSDDLETFNRLAVGRELRMIELKERINELCEQLGLPPEFDLGFAPSRQSEYDSDEEEVA